MVIFNRPYLTGNELLYIQDTFDRLHLSEGGYYSKLCVDWLENKTLAKKALLTDSCSAALELAAILADIKEGDEVILPSFTFVSTANAFVSRGAKPVFVDIKSDSLTIDIEAVESAITTNTRVIVPVHYAGVSPDMDVLMSLAERSNILVIEDAAQAIGSEYKGRALGTFGDLGTYSFHETKNVISGQGGALLVNHDRLIERSRIVARKGTNRDMFVQGKVDKYTWIDQGSSYLMSEVTAACLWAQLEALDFISKSRKRIWDLYHESFADLEGQGLLRRPQIPEYNRHNAHIYYILLESREARDAFIQFMKGKGIQCVFHYVPLHSSPYGQEVGNTCGDMVVTNHTYNCLVRLPLWIGLEEELDNIIESVYLYFRNN